MKSNIHPERLVVSRGRHAPMGPQVYSEGTRFTIFSRHATRVWLCVFEHADDKRPVWEFELDPEEHRIGDIWSIYVRNLPTRVHYMYRMDGPWAPKQGHRFNANLYLLDPCAKAFVGDAFAGTLRCVTVGETEWNHQTRPKTPMKDSIIYETHVRGFTIHPSSGVKAKGTYKGLIEKIPYLKELGITAVELLPVHELGETRLGRCSLVTGEELTNYWGYNSIGFFAPTGRYACSTVDLAHVEEFREMVRRLHEAEIEVILDVVFNHTSEGNERGPTLCFRGIDNSIYYILNDRGDYMNYSGCGNTFNCNHPVVREFIIECLRYWAAVMQIDGFRFDLASILGRDPSGHVLQDAPLIKRISEDPVLCDRKLIAEAWDAGGAYQVGSFGGARWAEWNGRYRDDVRRYWRGDSGTRNDFATRIMGSADLYQWAGRSPEHSINFVTCHDGFTLRDLVSYREKRNWANGENNRDGSDHNYSFNCGVEGDTEAAPDVYALRQRMQKNFLATLFLSLGVPMLLSGDEFGRTQRGNNNAYCQDNEISWCNWNHLVEHEELFRFCKAMIQFRKENPTLSRRNYYSGNNGDNGRDAADVIWFDDTGMHVDWTSSRTPIGCHIDPRSDGARDLCLLFNSSAETVSFPLLARAWLRRIDTSRAAPRDIVSEDEAELVDGQRVSVGPRSLVVLTARPEI